MIAKGQKINDRYEILKLIGEGGMANVYLAQDTILDRKVAVKVLRGDLSGDEKFVRRFQREALSASSLNHPNIVEMHDVGEDDGNFYIVMEYIEGKTLKQLIKKRGVLSIPEVMDIMLQLLDALAVAHDSYIIHRDIKPQNIMIKESGLVKITDFGIAMALNSAELTQTNSVMGSVHYLPPEQASGKGSTIKSDIYSLGILMFEMLTGKMPFKGDSAVEIALKHMREPLPSVAKYNPVIPQSVENIIIKAAAKNPKNRYKDVREMAEDIRTCLDEDKEDVLKIEFKYPENDFSDTKVVNVIKEEKKEAKEEKPVAKQITEEEVDEKKNKKKFVIIASIIMAFVALLILTFIFIPKFTEAKDVKIPDVYEMELSKAEEKLKKSGFKILSKKQASDTIKDGLVIETDPSKNRYVKEGSLITIYYSTGADKYEIEDYMGLNVYETKAKLELKGLKVIIEKKSVEDSQQYKGKEQQIIEQSIVVGKKVISGTTMVLYIPEIVSVYPDMVTDGWNLERATQFCEKYNLNIKVNYKEVEDSEENVVIAQDPKAEDEIYENGTLKIVVTKKPVVTTTTTIKTTTQPVKTTTQVGQ
ncbi:MAG: Stk1 family PASTA domain-containing Ser/Thr kinase [Bacilli bacterium]